MKWALGRIASILIVVLGWVLFGVRTALDFIGYSTAPEDLEVARTRLERGLDLLLATPWWALPGFALASTALLIWRSWPHARQPSGDDRATQAIPIDQLAAQRALDDLFAEGVAHRNKLLPIQAVDLLKRSTLSAIGAGVFCPDLMQPAYLSAPDPDFEHSTALNQKFSYIPTSVYRASSGWRRFGIRSSNCSMRLLTASRARACCSPCEAPRRPDLTRNLLRLAFSYVKVPVRIWRK